MGPGTDPPEGGKPPDLVSDELLFSLRRELMYSDTIYVPHIETNSG